MTPDLEQSIADIWQQEHRWMWLHGARAASADPETKEEVSMLMEIVISQELEERARAPKVWGMPCTTR